MNQLIRLITMTSMLACPFWAAASDCGSLSVARWVLGDWVAGGDKTVFHESWTEVGPQTFEGIGSEHAMADGKLIGSEALRLVEMAGGVFYIAKVAHNELPVTFRLTECSADRLLFENPTHDYPRRIEYRHEADGRMVVAVSDGKDKCFTLGFERGDAAADAGVSVLAVEDARFDAMTRADAAELGSWLADDLQYVHSTGQVESREQFLASIANGTFRYLEITPTERQVVLLGHGSALIRGQGRFQVVAGGNKLDLQIRYLAIYGLGGDGRWHLRSWQSLRLPPVAAPAQIAEKPEPVFAVTFRTGPGWDPSKAPNEQVHFADHSVNLRELRASGNILLGGRFGEIGLILLKAPSEAEARAMIVRDPSVQAGVFKAEVQAWSPFMSGCTGKNASQ